MSYREREQYSDNVTENLVERDCVTWGSKGETYRGNTSQTESGRTCQNWSSQSPHTHPFYTDYTTENTGIGTHAYCRNPNPRNNPRPWCFTTDENKNWEYCRVPFCELGETRHTHYRIVLVI